MYYHSVSTDEKPQHDRCPVGAESWCKYQRALALNQAIPPHTPRIANDLAHLVKPVFEDLCREDLLEKCLLGATQNRNESFNSLVWARAPKTEYVTRPSIIAAVAQAVLVFNSGSSAILPILTGLGIEPGPLCVSHLNRKDRYRQLRAQEKEEIQAKKRRKSKRTAEKRAEESRVSREEVTYASGGF